MSTPQPPQFPPPGGTPSPYQSPMAPTGMPSPPPSAGVPGGVIAVAVYNFVLGGLSILAGLCFLLGGAVFGLGGQQLQRELAQNPQLDEQARAQVESFFQIGGAVMVIVAVLVMVMAVLWIITGVGLLRLRNWARVTTLVLAGLSGVLALCNLLQLNLLGTAVLGAYCATAFVILLRSDTAARFH